ncbi:MAG TPA: hypothetical protein VIK77_05370 [Tissierellaceae bacterium]
MLQENTLNLDEPLLVIKSHDGNVHIKSMGKVRFVELKGKYGWI